MERHHHFSNRVSPADRGPANGAQLLLWRRYTPPQRSTRLHKRITGSAQSRLAHWFDTACFTQPSAYGFGNETRTDSAVRTAGIANWDTALMKTITLRESLNLQFTTEVFNLFNRVQFGIPNNVTGNGNFGVVSSQLNQPRLIQFSLRLGF